MKIKSKYTIIAAELVALTLFAACRRTELCYDHYPKASFMLSWEQEWERDYGMAHQTNWDASYHGFDYDFLRPGTPEWVNLVKYKNNTPDGEHYLSPGGGDILLSESDGLSFLMYNGDTEYIILEDIASLSDARASATPRSRSTISYIKERHPGIKSANPPDILYSSYMDNVPSIEVHETKLLPVKMQPLVFTYVIRYEFDYGLDNVALARGALAGMAESVYLRDGRTSEESTVILYDCQITDYGCEARVMSFGVPGFPDEYYGRSDEDVPSRPYTLNLEVLLTGGRVLEFDFDIDEQLKSQPRGGVIRVSGIRIKDEENETPSGEFEVDLSGWGVIDVDLPVNS